MTLEFRPMRTPLRVDILSAPVDCVDMARALDAVDEMVRGDRARTILAVNPEKVIKAQSDALLRRALADAGLLIPDGIGVVLAARLLHGQSITRVPGAELMPAICERATDRGYRVFLFGGSEAVNAAAAQVLRDRYPGIVIAGRQHGYVDDAGMGTVVDIINRSGANVLFIALGSPRQELWMEQHLSRLAQVRVCQGVGGTFDVLAGNVRRAPAWFRRLHLEWFYRLVTQPGRLMRQTALPRFAWQLLCAGILNHRARPR